MSMYEQHVQPFEVLPLSGLNSEVSPRAPIAPPPEMIAPAVVPMPVAAPVFIAQAPVTPVNVSMVRFAGVSFVHTLVTD